MVIRDLPYAGHSWSLSQHAVGLEPHTLYDFLKCAAPFEGQTHDYDGQITALMAAGDVLTLNRRDGTPDAWRDYQQILAELGLIYSTKIVRVLTLTELGHMFLAGEIGFSELIGIQALRYQYPNGQKSTIQGRLRTALESESLAPPATLTELQVNCGILLKPGTLVLRLLLELLQAGHAAKLSVSECQAFLIPCKTNQDWPSAFSEIVRHRANGGRAEIDGIYRHSRRNIQDWFKFLSKSDFFELNDTNVIQLSLYAKSSIHLMQSYCKKEEDVSSFWIPTSYEIDSRRGWFDWYGYLPYDTQEVLRSDAAVNQDYMSTNYVGGLEDDDDERAPTETAGVNLQVIDLDHLGRDTAFSFSGNIELLAENLRKGAQKRHAKTLLHDRIIKKLAETFILQGAVVQSDPNSIDLLATWPGGDSAIFEVKTVTRRSLQGRLRTAIGQVEEYAYRRALLGAGTSDKVIVVNTELSADAWQTDFLTSRLGIGLICTSPRSYRAFAPQTSSTKVFWHN